MKKKRLAPIVVFALALSSCTAENKVAELETTSETNTNDWIYLFDGTSTEGWRAYNGDSLPPGWIIEDKVLTFDTELGLERDYEGGEDIIYGAKEFDNFELYLEWRLPEGGNSGIFYHLKEGYDSPPEVSLKYRLIDHENHARMHDLADYNLSLGYTERPNELKPLQQTGSDYAMHPADSTQKVLNPVDEWNSSKIVFTPEKVEHWLHGQKTLIEV